MSVTLTYGVLPGSAETTHCDGGYSVWLRFRDGAAGTLDLRAELRGEVFEPMLDEQRFSSFRVEGGAPNRGDVSYPRASLASAMKR